LLWPLRSTPYFGAPAQRSPVTHFHLTADTHSKIVKLPLLLLGNSQTSSADFEGLSPQEAERENHMAVTDSETLHRLRREEGLAEQKGRQAMNIAVILKDHPQYEAARRKADHLMAKASALREQITRIETS
jgi:hypothetical protein